MSGIDGFVPVPHEALNAFEVGEWHAVMDLYKRAHALRWRPFRFTERSLCERWKLSNRRVWSILDALADLGLLEVTRGDKRTESSCHVKCPTRESGDSIVEARHRDQHRDQQKDQQNGAGTMPVTDEPAAQGAAQGAAQVAAPPTRAETESRDGDPRESLPAPPEPTLVGPPAPPKIDPHREAWHTAALFWGSQVLPACGRKPSSGPESPSKGIGSKLMTAVRRDPDAVLDALRFMAWSQHDRAEFIRSKRYDLDTVLRHVDTYAGLWREFGDRPVSEPQRRTGGPAPPSAGDGVLDRLWAMEQERKRAEEFEA